MDREYRSGALLVGCLGALLSHGAVVFAQQPPSAAKTGAAGGKGESSAAAELTEPGVSSNADSAATEPVAPEGKAGAGEESGARSPETSPADASAPASAGDAAAKTETAPAPAAAEMGSVRVDEVEPTGAAAIDREIPLPMPNGGEPSEPLRKAELGGVVGMLYRAADGGDVSYAAGLAYGGYARVELRSWAALRMMVTQSEHGVTVRRGALGLSDSTIEQSDFSLLEMSARVEPTWVISPRLRVRGAVGMGWARLSVPSPSSDGGVQIRTAERHGVMLDAIVGVSASYDLIPNWLVAEAGLDGGMVWGESGGAFERLQAFDQDGHRLFVDALPDFNGTLSALLSLGILL